MIHNIYTYQSRGMEWAAHWKLYEVQTCLKSHPHKILKLAYQGYHFTFMHPHVPAENEIAITSYFKQKNRADF